MNNKKPCKNKPRLIDLTREQVFDIVETAYNTGFCEGRRVEREEYTDITGLMCDIENKHGKL
jgi:hypothetical protein|tara:strand:- start:441 stop:626 length:186 start_codon:yes stop_codon:yes gene_type:complete